METSKKIVAKTLSDPATQSEVPLEEPRYLMAKLCGSLET